MSHRTTQRHHLSDEDRAFLAALVSASSLTDAARAVGLPRQTTAALLVPEAGVRAGTIELARVRIAAARAAAA